MVFVFKEQLWHAHKFSVDLTFQRPGGKQCIILAMVWCFKLLVVARKQCTTRHTVSCKWRGRGGKWHGTVSGIKPCRCRSSSVLCSYGAWTLWLTAGETAAQKAYFSLRLNSCVRLSPSSLFQRWHHVAVSQEVDGASAHSCCCLFTQTLCQVLSKHLYSTPPELSR